MTTDPEQAELGRRLNVSRLAFGLTQEQVAKNTGLPRSAISDIEHGRRKVDSLELRTLARLYSEGVAHYLGDAPARPSEPDVLARRLVAVTGNLHGYLEERAREIAEPHIQVAEEEAARRVSQVEHDLSMSRDLVAELRRQCAALVKQVERRPAPVSERTPNDG